MFSFPNDPDKRTLVRYFPESEWTAYYRLSTLPEISLSPANCSRFELIGSNGVSIDESHLYCSDGISTQKGVKEFAEYIETSEKYTFAELVYSLWKGTVAYNIYTDSIVVGYLSGEPNLAIKYTVQSYKGIYYAIETGEDEYCVLTDEWIERLRHKGQS